MHEESIRQDGGLALSKRITQGKVEVPGMEFIFKFSTNWQAKTFDGNNRSYSSILSITHAVLSKLVELHSFIQCHQI